MTYTQPALLDPPATWADVVDTLAKRGIQLERQTQTRKGPKDSAAEWWDAHRSADGTYTWVRVLHRREPFWFRWQVSAYTLRPDRHRVELADPTPAEAMAAAAVLGIQDPSPCMWGDVRAILTAAGVDLERQPDPPLTADYRREWRAEADRPRGTRVELVVQAWKTAGWVMVAHRLRPRPLGEAGPEWRGDHLVVLTNPTPADAKAALSVVGLGGDSDEA